jgi:hypothetical protein
MAAKKKAPPKRKTASAKAAPPKRVGSFKPPKKPKMPTLGGGMMGLGGTGAGGMLP